MIFFQFFIWFLLVLLLANVLANLTVLGRMRPVEPPAEGPLVSVLLPIQGDDPNIEACVRALMQQDYPRYELIIIDDDASYASTELAESLIQDLSDPRISARVIPSEWCPEGWLRKNWACHQLAREASGEYLFFTDTSVICGPGTIAAAVDCASRENAGLLSAWPRQVTAGWAERLTAPMQYVAIFAFFPVWLQRLMQRSGEGAGSGLSRLAAVANSQFLFFSRDGYNAIGGHAAVQSQAEAGFALAHQVSACAPQGLRLINCDAVRFATVSLHRSFGETWSDSSKYAREAFNRHPVLFGSALAIQVVCLTAPFYLLFTSSLVFPLAALLSIRALLATRFRSDWLSVLLHPVGAALILLFQFSAFLGRRDGQESISPRDLARADEESIG